MRPLLALVPLLASCALATAGQTEEDINFGADRPVSRSLSEPSDLRWSISEGSPASHDPSPPMPLSARGDLHAACVDGKAAMLSWLGDHYTGVQSWVTSKSAAKQDQIWRACLDG